MPFRCGEKKILVADKSKVFLNVTKTLLEVAGFRVKTAKDGEEALGHIKKFKYDLLVLGVVMPRIDGIRLLHLVRTNKRYANVPMLFVSDHAGNEELITRQEEATGKAQGRIQKPFMAKAFLEIVEALLEKNKTVKALPN